MADAVHEATVRRVGLTDSVGAVGDVASALMESRLFSVRKMFLAQDNHTAYSFELLAGLVDLEEVRTVHFIDG